MPTTDQLHHYAEVLLRIGLNIQPGQPMHISAPLEAAEFVRILVAQAYDVGASTVDVDWEDPLSRRIRFEKEADEFLAQFPHWPVQRALEMCNHNTAFLYIDAENPDLLAGIDSRRIALFHKARGTALKPVDKYFMEDRVTWLVCSIPSKDWAMKMFPDETDDVAIDKLWDVIFATMRMNKENPVDAWQDHLDGLEARAQFLNGRHFKSLYYQAPGTNLTVELPDLHFWQAARSVNGQGHWFVANLPTEEVYTLPKREGVHGVVRSTKPLAYGGVIIEGIQLTFENGRIVDYQAATGYDTLQELIETDEGSHYLGEVALVPMDSPISNMNTLFYNTLFDENASCHLAIGEAYPTCLDGGKEMSKEDLERHGVNDSITHVDFMVGSSELNIDGMLADGTAVPLFRAGNWVI